MKYPTIEKGDTLGIVSPSSGLSGIFKERFMRGVEVVKNLGFNVILGKHVLGKGYISGKPEERAKDINEFIIDDSVKGILTSIGGDHSVQLLNLIDFKQMSKTPKVFVGFSDITVLHLAFLRQSKVSTFYGPSVLSNFGEIKPIKHTIDSFISSTRRNPFNLGKSKEYTDEFINWDEEKEAKSDFKKTKLKVIREGKAEGKLIGGCLPSLIRTFGTSAFVDFKNSVCFLELPEGKEPFKPYSLSEVDADLSQLIQSGVFEGCNALLFGIPYRYDEKMKEELWTLISDRFSHFEFPIISELNFGHTDPIYTIPYGQNAKVNTFDAPSIFVEGIE